MAPEGHKAFNREIREVIGKGENVKVGFEKIAKSGNTHLMKTKDQIKKLEEEKEENMADGTTNGNTLEKAATNEKEAENKNGNSLRAGTAERLGIQNRSVKSQRRKNE